MVGISLIALYFSVRLYSKVMENTCFLLVMAAVYTFYFIYIYIYIYIKDLNKIIYTQNVFII